jgi:hypothetical protein
MYLVPPSRFLSLKTYISHFFLPFILVQVTAYFDYLNHCEFSTFQDGERYKPTRSSCLLLWISAMRLDFIFRFAS